MQFCFMPEEGTFDGMFILGMLQNVYHAMIKKFQSVYCTCRNLLTEYQGRCWNGQLGRNGYN